MLDELYKEVNEHMHKSVEAVSREFSAVRTGKASIHLLDTVKVEAYGAVMPLNQVATVTIPEARLISVQAFDKATVGDIVKAIQKADLGLNPTADGQLIRIPVPALNEERRIELARRCKTIAEDGRIAVRNIRRDANDTIKKAEKNKEVSKDQEADGHDRVQELTDNTINEIDSMLKKKEAEVLEI